MELRKLHFKQGLDDSTAHSSLGITRSEVSTLVACENHLGDL